MTPLSDSDRNRLSSMLALAERQQNPADGERLAALAAAERLLAKRNLRLRDLAQPPAVERPAQPAWPPHWRDTARECLDQSERLTDWELDFLTSLARFHRLTEKQSAVLAKIAKRLGVRDAS